MLSEWLLSLSLYFQEVPIVTISEMMGRNIQVLCGWVR